MLNQGMNRQQIIDEFIKRFGGAHVLGAPPDTGFNRLAWALPYGLGLAGAGVLAMTAWRFSHKPKPAAADSAREKAADGTLTNDPDLEDRLEDELSKIDT
jgi:cytochrome c-type biogenesis protein CcmH/NrfF